MRIRAAGCRPPAAAERPPLDRDGDPERQIALQERRPLAEVAPGDLVQRQLDERVGREGVRRLERPGRLWTISAFFRAAARSRMDVLAHHERRGRREQEHVLRRHVRDQVDGTLAERDGREEPVAGRIRDRAPYAPEAHGRTQQQTPHQRDGRCHDEERGVDPAGLECRRRAFAREGQELRVLRRDAAVAQQPQRERPDAAAFLADLDTEAAEIVETVQRPGCR